MIVVNGGRVMATGPNGPVVEVVGTGDPNTATAVNGLIDLTLADVGSVFHRTDAPDATHAFYVKTAFVQLTPGTWTNK